VKAALALFTGAVVFMAAVVVNEWGNESSAPGPIAIQTVEPKSPVVPEEVPPKPVAVPAPVPVAPSTQIGLGAPPARVPNVGGTKPPTEGPTKPPQQEPAPPAPSPSPEQTPPPSAPTPTPTPSPEPTRPSVPTKDPTKEQQKEAKSLSKCQIPPGGPTLAEVLGGCSVDDQSTTTQSGDSVPSKSADDGVSSGEPRSENSKYDKGDSKKD
jgi:outer membrane biosynthesis protein TonB